MAVVRMTGRIDGAEVIFSLMENGQWSATVPPDVYGEFVVEVTAWDEAGNTAYSTAMLFSINPGDLSFQVIPLLYAYKVVNEGFSEVEIQSEYTFYMVGSHVDYVELPPNFTAKVV
ncbi:PF13754 domain-containing protein [Domibacillus sp.]|uniref:PF13754 domain-containing protein n=1 Tax=Domibacillus sp. TaxID=1969783 RepID=UPI002810F71D|nr:PF13754 domain-containing protein [Domibacillus sp.]